ncbi:MAG: amidohydrolase family protein [Caldilineaceae bacterium]
MLPIVDTHQHLWDLDLFHLPWAASSPILNRSYRTADYLAATDGLNVVKAVYMEVDVTPEQQAAEAEFIIDLCQQADTPTVGAVISGRPAASEFAAYIRRFAPSPYIKGVRQVLHVPETPPGYCLAPAYIQGVQLLGELGLSFDLCMRPAELLDAAALVAQCPDTQFILDHCGNADPYVIKGDAPAGDASDPFYHTKQQWCDGIDKLASFSNVVCKISGIVARAQPGWQPADLAPTINYCLDAFGPNRVIFGGDWPVCTLGAPYADWATALRTVIASRPEAEQRKLLHDNAVRLYGLD